MALVMAMTTLTGCGLVPEAFPLLGHDEKKALFTAVVRGVQCEIRRAVVQQINDPRYGKIVNWLKKWSALIRMELVFGESASFSPGVRFLTPNLMDAIVWRADGTTRTVSQNYDFGVGGRIEGKRSRTEIIEYFYPFDNFVDGAEPDDLDLPCYHAKSFFIVGDLKLRDWLDDVLEPFKRCAFLGRAGAGRSGALIGVGEGEGEDQSCDEKELAKQGASLDNPIHTFSHTVEFDLSLEAYASPSWTFVRIQSPSGSGSSNLFDATRHDSSKVIITLGAASTDPKLVRQEKGERKTRTGPSIAMQESQAALRIGSAVANANQALLGPRF